MKYVQRRANRYEFRFPLPDDLAGKPVSRSLDSFTAPLVNAKTGRFKTELVRSLKTNSGQAADRLALPLIAAAHAMVDAARNPDPSRANQVPINLANLASAHEAQVLAGDERLRRSGVGLDLSKASLAPDGKGMTRDDLDLYGFTVSFLEGELRDQAIRMRPEPEFENLAQAMIREQEGDGSSQPDNARELALQLITARRKALNGIAARLQGEDVPTPVVAPPDSVLRLMEAFDRWAAGTAGGKGKPREQTAAEARRAVARFVELHGNLPLTSITKAHGREFRDALVKLPKHLSGRHQKMTLPQLLKADLSSYEPRSAQTVNKVLALVSGIIARAERDGYFYKQVGWSNPFYVSFEIQARARTPFEPFSLDELKRLFASPVFASGLRPLGGSGDAAFWFPLIALYSGARRTEIAQLRIGDVRTSPEGIHFFDFNDDGDDQHLKNASSARSVPIHPELVAKGLLDYVAERRSQARSDQPLWPGFEPPIAGKTKAWTKLVRQIFGRACDDCQG